jgi:undecaprenyl phosphate-alpha-L-ara4N flippase subunit ArnF
MLPILQGYAFALLTALTVIIGDTAIKIAADHGQPLGGRWLLVGCGLYVLSALMWFGAMHHVGLAQAGIAYSMLTLLALVLIGAVWFGEPLGLREAAGIACALLAMVLLIRFV